MVILPVIHNLLAGPERAFPYKKEFATAHTDESKILSSGNLLLVIW